MNMLFGGGGWGGGILVNYTLQVLLLPAAAPNPTGAGCLFYYSLVGGSGSTGTFS